MFFWFILVNCLSSPLLFPLECKLLDIRALFYLGHLCISKALKQIQKRFYLDKTIEQIKGKTAVYKSSI